MYKQINRQMINVSSIFSKFLLPVQSHICVILCQLCFIFRNTKQEHLTQFTSTCGQRKESSPDCDWSRLPSGLIGKINIGIKSYSYPTTVEDFRILPYWIIGSQFSFQPYKPRCSNKVVQVILQQVWINRETGFCSGREGGKIKVRLHG